MSDGFRPSANKAVVLAAGRWLVLIAVLIAALMPAAAAQAHGGAVSIGVSCLTPDQARPLSKVCTAVVRYVDGYPVGAANLSLSASREDGDQRSFGPVAFRPAGEAGVYTAAFEYPAYGRWLARIEVTEPGQGEAAVREEVLPPLPGTAGSRVSEARVRIVLDFDKGELTNISMRVLHLGAAAAWFGASGLVLAASLFLNGPERERVMRSLAGWFPWVATASFLALALTGWYNAVYNVPTRPPGLFDPQLTGRLPFGSAYLMAFAVKMGLTALMVLVAGALALTLRRTISVSVRPMIAGGSAPSALPAMHSRRSVVVLSGLNVLLGILVFVAVVVLGYLHILTHIGGLSGAG